MKIVLNEKAYIQEKDVDYILTNFKVESIPNEFLNEMRLDEYGRFRGYHPSPKTFNDYYEFTGDTSIEFIKQLDMLADFNRLKNMTLEEIDCEYRQTKYENQILEQDIINCNVKESGNALEKWNNRKYLIKDIKNYILVRTNKRKNTIPEDVEYNERTYSKGIKKAIKKVLKRY